MQVKSYGGMQKFWLREEFSSISFLLKQCKFQTISHPVYCIRRSLTEVYIEALALLVREKDWKGSKESPYGSALSTISKKPISTKISLPTA